MRYYHRPKRCMSMKNIDVFAKIVEITIPPRVGIVNGLGKNGKNQQILGGMSKNGRNKFKET